MTDGDFFLDLLRRRMRVMNSLWERAVSDMTLEQVNHHERDGVLPIAFSLMHYMRSQDQSISVIFLGQAPLWATGGWAEKIGVSADFLGREESVETIQHLRFKDFDAYRAYQSEVIAQTDRVLDGLTVERLREVFLPRVPDNFKQTFMSMVVGEGPVHRAEVLECFVYQHGLRHMGEIEHARALVGLGGMTS